MDGKRLFRSLNNRMLCGVCGGIGEYFNIDPTLVRLLAAVIASSAASPASSPISLRRSSSPKKGLYKLKRPERARCKPQRAFRLSELFSKVSGIVAAERVERGAEFRRPQNPKQRAHLRALQIILPQHQVVLLHTQRKEIDRRGLEGGLLVAEGAVGLARPRHRRRPRGGIPRRFHTRARRAARCRAGKQAVGQHPDAAALFPADHGDVRPGEVLNLHNALGVPGCNVNAHCAPHEMENRHPLAGSSFGINGKL